MKGHAATVIRKPAKPPYLKCDCGKEFSIKSKPGDPLNSPEWEDHVKKERVYA